MSKLTVPVVILLALALTAHVASADDAPAGPRSRDTAVLLSTGGTALSAGLLMAGASAKNATLVGAGLLSSLVTPSAGAIYAGRPLTVGMGLRVLSAGVAVAGFADAFGNVSLDAPLIIGSALGYGVAILYDIATAGAAVDDYNRRFHLRVAPTVIPSASSGPAVGVGIGGSF